MRRSQSDDYKKLIPLKRIAEASSYSFGYVSILVQRKKLKAKKIGNKYYSTKEWFDQYLGLHARDEKRLSSEAVQELSSNKVSNKQLISESVASAKLKSQIDNLVERAVKEKFADQTKQEKIDSAVKKVDEENKIVQKSVKEKGYTADEISLNKLEEILNNKIITPEAKFIADFVEPEIRLKVKWQENLHQEAKDFLTQQGSVVKKIKTEKEFFSNKKNLSFFPRLFKTALVTIIIVLALISFNVFTPSIKIGANKIIPGKELVQESKNSLDSLFLTLADRISASSLKLENNFKRRNQILALKLGAVKDQALFITGFWQVQYQKNVNPLFQLAKNEFSGLNLGLTILPDEIVNFGQSSLAILKSFVNYQGESVGEIAYLIQEVNSKPEQTESNKRQGKVAGVSETASFTSSPMPRLLALANTTSRRGQEVINQTKYNASVVLEDLGDRQKELSLDFGRKLAKLTLATAKGVGLVSKNGQAKLAQAGNAINQTNNSAQQIGGSIQEYNSNGKNYLTSEAGRSLWSLHDLYSKFIDIIFPKSLKNKYAKYYLIEIGSGKAGTGQAVEQSPTTTEKIVNQTTIVQNSSPVRQVVAPTPKNLSIIGDTTVGGALNVSGATKLKDKLTVSGASEFLGDAVFNSALTVKDLIVTGSIKLNGVTITDGSLITGTQIINNNTYVTGTFSAGHTEVPSLGSTGPVGSQSLSAGEGGLTVAGDTYLNGEHVLIAGMVDLNNLLNIDQNGLALTVGDGTNDTFSVNTSDDIVTITGSLNHSGTSQFNGDIDLNGALDLDVASTSALTVGDGTNDNINIDTINDILTFGNSSTTDQMILNLRELTLNSASSTTALTVRQDGDGDIINLFDGANEVFTILDGGNVGIGTTSPQTIFHIVGTDGLIIPVGTTAERPTSITGAIRYNSETSQFEGYGNTSWGSLGGVIDVDQDTKITAEDSAGADNDQLKFSTAGTEWMRIDSNGNIGIGTTSPFQSLSVAGNMALTGAFYDSLSAAGTNGMVLQTTGLTTQWVATSTLGILAIGNEVIYGTPESVLFIDADGNLAQDNPNFYWDYVNNRLGVGTEGLYINSAGLLTTAGNSISLTTQSAGDFIDNAENPTDYESENSGPTGTIDAQVSADTDDGLGYYNSGSWLFDTSIGLAGAGTLESFASIDRVGSGLRFAGVNIPEGVTITSAYLSFYAVRGLPQIGGSGTKSKITGELSTSASTFSSLSDYQTRRGTIVGGANNNNITTAQVGWDDATWTASSWNNSPDISSVIQEIADLGAVTNLALFFDDHDNLSTSGNYIYAANSYEAGVSTAPRLHIEYGSSDTNLVAYAESTIKTQGSYSLRGEATITDSLNKTLTRTLDVPLNLSNINTIYFDLRSNRTGSNIKIGLHDSGGTTTEITPDLTSANAFQNITWDISGVVNASKDAIDQIIITIVNADSANTFYLDNIYFPDTANQSIAFSINNSERMRIAASGNIGIGTDNPTSLLNIAGTLGVSGLATFSGTPTGSGIGQGSVYINPTESGEGAPVFQGWEAQTDWDMENIPSLDVVPALADLDNDGDYDLLMNLDGIIGAYENTGSATSPTWTARPEWNVPTDFGSWGYPTVADLDNDGDFDLLVGTTADMAYGVENTGNATSPAWALKTEWNTPVITNTDMNLPTLGDLDGDGDYDLMVGFYNNGGAYIILGYENIGTVSLPSWSAEPSWNIPIPANYAIYPILSDFDDDGDQDLFIGNWLYAANSVYGFENTGDGSAPVWTNNPDWAIAVIGGINIPAFADLDDDGDKDMLLSTRTGIIRGYEQIKEVIHTTIFGVALNGSEMLRVSSDGITNILNGEVTNNLIVSGNVGIGTTEPTARLHLGAGTSAVGTAPLKFTSGTLLTDPEAGVMEFLGDNYYLTITSGYQYQTQYPPEQSATYVRATSENTPQYMAYFATDPNKSLIGDDNNDNWNASNGATTNQRFHIDLGSAKTVTKIYYENAHDSGNYTEAGVRHFTFWGSNDSSAFDDLTYGDDTNWTQLTTLETEFEQHVAANTPDPKYITVENNTAYRYYAFKFADNWGSYFMAVRRIELQQQEGENEAGSRKGIVLNDGVNLVAGRVPFATTNGRLIDTADFVFNGTNLGIGTTSPFARLSVVGDAYIAGNLTATGTITSSGLSVSGDILPSANLTYNIGSSSYRWNEGWFDTLNIGTSTWSIKNSDNGRLSIFDSASGAGNERVSILTNGNVGIGTAAPGYKLSVSDLITNQAYISSEVTNAKGVFTAYSPSANYPRTQFLTGNTASDVNAALVIAPLYSSIGVGKQSFISIDTNKDTLDESHYNAVISVAIDGTTSFLTAKKGGTEVGGGDIIIGPAATERMRITATGNVGIGTTSPYAKLSVVGPAVAEYFNATSTTATSTFAGGLVAGNGSLNVLQNGNIGIGTVSPGYKLDVNGSIRLGDIATPSHVWVIPTTGEMAHYYSTETQPRTIFDRDFNGATQDGWFFGSGGSSTIDATAVGIARSGTRKLGLFTSDGSTRQERFTIDGNGYVGIGTTSPYAKLSVENTLGGLAPLFTIASSTVGAATSTYLTVASNGNVGVGTTNPTTAVEISGLYPELTITGTNSSLYHGGALVLNTSADVKRGQGLYMFNGSSDTEWFSGRPYDNISSDYYVVGRKSSVSAHDRETAATSHAFLTITNTGNVGIGTTSPYQTLSVSGNMALTGAFYDSLSSAGTNGMILKTTGSATEWVATSTLFTAGVSTLPTGTNGQTLTYQNSAWTATSSLYIEANGNIGVGVTSPSAFLHLAAGTTTAGAAPLKFTAGTLLATSEAGAIEFDGNSFYGSINSNGFVSNYPLAYSDTYVKATSIYDASYWPYYATNPSLSVTGSQQNNNSWVGANGSITNQRFHIDLGSSMVVTRIYYENAHHYGGSTGGGVKNFTLWGSNDANAFAELTYGIDTNWTQLTTSQSTFDQHVAADQADPKYINVTNNTAYRYYAFKFADRWSTESWMGVRRIELQSGSVVGDRKGFVLNDGIDLISGRIPFATTNGRLTDNANFVFDGTNLGVGTTSPYQTLSVAGNMALTGALYDSLSSAGTNGMILKTTGSATEWVATSTLFTAGIDSLPIGATGQTLTYQNSAWTATSSLYIASNGNVGIGTTSPNSLLYLQSDNPKITLDDNYATLRSYSIRTHGGNFYLKDETIGADVITVLPSTAIGGGLIIDPYSNVSGLNPGSTSYATRLSSAANNHFVFDLLNNDINDAIAFRYSAGLTSTVDTIGFVMKGSGNVGIGTTTPNTLLDVYSSAAVSTSGQNVLKLQAAVASATVGSGPRIVFTGNGTSSGSELADIRGYTFGAGATGLAFGTGFGAVTTKMVIDNSGDVSIGSTTPYAKLSVTNTGTGPSFIVEDSTSPDATPFIIDASGNVGIGTTTPNTLLDVYSSAAVSTSGQNVLKLQAAVAYATVGSGPRIVFTGNGTSSGSELADIRGYTFGAGATGLAFGTGFGAVTTKMVIDNSGDVGIGTTNPSYSLDVAGTFRASSTSNAIFGNGSTGGISLGDGSITKSSGVNFTFNSGVTANSFSTTGSISAYGGTIGVDTTSGYYIAFNNAGLGAGRIGVSSSAGTGIFGNGGLTYATVFGTDNATPLQFFTNDTARMTIDSTSGNVGIGTTSPYAKLSVENTLGGSAPLFVVASSTAGAATSTYLTVASNGNVGIGTTSPTSRLSIIGSGSTSSTYSFNVNNSSGNNIIMARDDNRVKIGQSYDTTISKTLEVAGNFNFDTVANPTNAQTQGMVLTNSGAGSIPAGTYYYAVAFGTADGDTGGASYTIFPTITSASDFSVSISNIPTSTDPRVTKRKIYRSQAGTVGDYYYLYYIGTINDNTTTTYSDNSAMDTTATDWIYNKNNTTAGIIYRDGVVFGRLGNYVTAFGNGAMPVVTRGSTSSAFGSGALAALTTGNDNDAFGNGAVASLISGIGNAGFGYATLQGNQTGSSNAAFGQNALRNNSNYSYSFNNAFGSHALFGLTTNNNSNNALGYGAGRNAQGSYGTYLGYAAGYQASATTVGNYNIVIGSDSGSVLGSGANNILIGKDVELTSPTTSNQLNIGNLIFATGMDGTGTTLSTGKVGIGSTTPYAKLSVTNTGTGPSFIVEDSTSPDATPFIIDASGNVGIGTTSPQALLTVGSSTPVYLLAGDKYNSAYISGLLEVGGTGTSTIASNLDVLGTLHATNSYVGDLIFANNFRFTEAASGITPQALFLQNQNGENIMSFDENGSIIIGKDSVSEPGQEPEVKIVELTEITASSTKTAFIVNQSGSGDIADFQANGVSIMNIAQSGEVKVAGSMLVDGRIMLCAGGYCSNALDSAVDETMADLGVEGKVVAGAFEGYCEDGFVWVPGSAKYGTLPGFCVQADLMKDELDQIKTNISQGEAQIACQTLGTGYHLIGENEWLTIAENILQNPDNDSDTNIAGMQLATTSISYKLNNDNLINNLVGEVSEWTDSNITQDDTINPLSDEWQEYNLISSFKSLQYLKPAYYLTSSNNGIGKILTGAGDVPVRGFIRGFDGIYSLDLSHSPAEQNNNVGFRCTK